MQLIGKYMEGDIWLSRQTITHILNEDLVNDLTRQVKQMEPQSVESYIKGLIERINNLEVA